MATRKVKHARALAKREEFMKTVKEGNQEVLRKAEAHRKAEKQREEAARLEQKKEKSRRLALKNGALKPRESSDA